MLTNNKIADVRVSAAAAAVAAAVWGLLPSTGPTRKCTTHCTVPRALSVRTGIHTHRAFVTALLHSDHNPGRSRPTLLSTAAGP